MINGKLSVLALHNITYSYGELYCTTMKQHAFFCLSIIEGDVGNTVVWSLM